MAYIQILPETLGDTIKATAMALATTGAQARPATLLYVEKVGGFQCRTCLYSTATNATHGTCKIMHGPIHMDHGCCAAWMPDTAVLHLYREPEGTAS